MNITSSNTTIFTREGKDKKIHYRAGLSTKNINGEYESGYIDIRLPKNVELENKTKINITKGFLSFYNYKDTNGDTKTIFYIVVQEFTTNEQEVYKVESNNAEQYELPF